MDSLRWLWGAIRTDAVTDVETGFCGPDDRPWGATIVADPAGAEPQEMGFRLEKYQTGRRRDAEFGCVCEQDIFCGWSKEEYLAANER